MRHSSTHAVATRIAHAVLVRLPKLSPCDHCVILDDRDDDPADEIRSLLSERSPRGLEVQS
jgi:hypothetical protein